MIITGDLNYSDPITQEKIETSLQQLENTSYVTSSIYTESWLRTYLSFLERSEEFLNITTGSEQNFIDSLKEVFIVVIVIILGDFFINFFSLFCF